MRVMTVVFLLAMFSGCRSFHPPDETTKHHSWGITEHRRNYFSFYSENTSANDGVEKDFEWNFQFSSRANIGGIPPRAYRRDHHGLGDIAFHHFVRS